MTDETDGGNHMCICGHEYKEHHIDDACVLCACPFISDRMDDTYLWMARMRRGLGDD